TFLEYPSSGLAALPGTFRQPLPEPCRHLPAMRVSIEDKTEKCRNALISAELSQEGVPVSGCRSWFAEIFWTRWCCTRGASVQHALTWPLELLQSQDQPAIDARPSKNRDCDAQNMAAH